MEVVYRNFMRLMAAGAFSAENTVEPMSRFKWNQMLMLAATYDVADYVASGIISTAASNPAAVPKSIVEEAYAKYNSPAGTSGDPRQGATPTADGADKFANLHLRHKFKKLVYNEIHSIDTSISTLTFLNKIIDNINGIIYGGIDFRQMIGLGLYLRNNGGTIDFVKTEQWLRSLGLKKPANLVGSYLTAVFGFDESEVQFMTKPDKDAFEKAVKRLRYTLSRALKEFDIRDYQDKLARKLHIPDSRILGRMGYFPSEVACKFITGIGKSLSNIEE